MSRTLLESVTLLRGIPATQKAVLVVLAAHAWHDGTNARPSQQTIAEMSGLSARSVRNGLHDLEAAGRIVPEAYNGGGRGHAVQYTIRLDALGINPATVAAFRPRNPAPDARKPGTDEPETRQNMHVNPATVAAQSGKNHPLNQKEESRESADAPSSSSSSEKNDESQTPEPEPEPDMPCQKEQDVLQAFCQATDVETPMRAWRQYAAIFLETHSTPAEITTGYRLMQRQFANYEHKPGIKSLAQHWDEWRSKAKSSLAADRAYRNIPRFEEPTDEERAAMMHSLRHGPWNTVQDTLRARRAPDAPRSYEDLPDIWNPPTPEELAERDAKRAARWQEHLASMRAATAPREEEMAVS